MNEILTNGKHMRRQHTQRLSMVLFNSLLWVKFFYLMIWVDGKQDVSNIGL